MSVHESSRSIDEAASEWAARLDRGPLPPEDDARLQAWLNADRRRPGALMRAQAYALMSESAQALGPHFNPAHFAEYNPVSAAGMSRRGLLAWSGSIAAGASLVALGVSMSANAAISTGRGELRLVPLTDGSTVMLNTDSSIKVEHGDRERLVTLLAGEAYFSVTHDAAHPFVVDVDGRRLRTAQANFRVRKLDDAPVDVLVHHGVVQLAPASPRQQPPILLSSNMRLTLAKAGFFRSPAPERPTPVAPEAVTRELAWLEGKIAFEGETFQQAADTFARYSDTRILIRGADLAQEPVSGLFAANDPVGFSRAVARVFDAKMAQHGDTITLSRSAPAR